MIILLIIASLIILWVLGTRLIIVLYENQSICLNPKKQFSKVAVVFGAGLREDGSATQLLRDRVTRAVELFNDKTIDVILLTGSRSSKKGDEISAMLNYALQMGVPMKDILFDDFGNRTYDSCLHIRSVFGFKEAYLVTQRFHLPRALLISQRMGINCLGIPSDLSNYSLLSRFFWSLREIPATIFALFELLVRPLPNSS
jgi:vancomycin permeability regulator SanA